MLESEIMKRCQITASELGARLFRNNVGQGWVGKLYRPHIVESTFVRPGDVILRAARPLHAGLCEGSSDLVGWSTIEITREMVGRHVAVFTACENKQEGQYATLTQRSFLRAVNEAGGVGIVAHSVDEFRNELIARHGKMSRGL